MRIGVVIDPRSVKNTQAAFHRVQRWAQYGAWKMINRMAGLFLRSAVKATPIGKKKRPVSTARNREELRIQGGWKYGIKVFGKSQGMRFARRYQHRRQILGDWWWTNDRGMADSLADIWYRGAAKASWGGMLNKMRWPFNPASDRLKTVMYRTNWVTFKKTPPRQSIVLTNTLSYMQKIAPNVQRVAMEKARASFEHQERAAFNRGVRIAWGAAA